MEFGWINLFGVAVVIFLMIPNIVYATRNKDEKNRCTNKYMNIMEQICRYSCIVLMWFPFLVWEFKFNNIFEMLLYIVGNCLLLVIYWSVFAQYLKEKSVNRALVLAILPTCIFLLSGLLLRHWLLVCFAFIFAVGHIYVTKKNI